MGFSAKDEAGGLPTALLLVQGWGSLPLHSGLFPPLALVPPPAREWATRAHCECHSLYSRIWSNHPVPVPLGHHPDSHGAGLVPTPRDTGQHFLLCALTPWQQGGALPDNTQLYVNILPLLVRRCGCTHSPQAVLNVLKSLGGRHRAPLGLR